MPHDTYMLNLKMDEDENGHTVNVILFVAFEFRMSIYSSKYTNYPKS